MFKYLVCCLLALSSAGCREKTDLEKSYVFAEKAGWHFMREKLRGQTDTLYTPDYAQALALADSAIRYSPDNPRFYGLKADYYESTGHYRGALDTYLRLIRRDSSQA